MILDKGTLAYEFMLGVYIFRFLDRLVMSQSSGRMAYCGKDMISNKTHMMLDVQD